MSNNENGVLVFDTEKRQTKIETVHVKTLDLIPPDWPSLYRTMPEFDFNNPPIDPNELASSLVETCKKHNGLGLSANQCGYEYRVFVMGAGEHFIACFNPKVISLDEETSHMPEGCLSFPLLQLNITRPKTVVVEYQDWTGEVHTQTFVGLTARVFLHELDHMNGIVYTDKAKPLALQSGLKKMQKIQRKYFNPKIMKKLNNGQTNSGRR